MASVSLELVEYVRHINAAAVTRPFVARDRHGELWVVKARDDGDRCHLWRDFVGGRLALWLGLPWPNPVVHGHLSDALFKNLVEQEEEPASHCVLASKHIDGLQLPDYGLRPFGMFTSNDPFVSLKSDERLGRVRRALGVYCAEPANLEAIYGRVVFDNWLRERDPMMDMLQVGPDKRLICLDASTSLNLPEDYYLREPSSCEIHNTKAGLSLIAMVWVEASAGFAPWLERLSAFSPEIWDTIVGECPPAFRRPTKVPALREQTVDIEAFLHRFSGDVLEGLRC